MAPTRPFSNCSAARKFSTRRRKSAPRPVPSAPPKPRRRWKKPRRKLRLRARPRRPRVATRRNSLTLCLGHGSSPCPFCFRRPPLVHVPSRLPPVTLLFLVVRLDFLQDGREPQPDRHCCRRRSADRAGVSGLHLVAEQSRAGAGTLR